MYVYLSYFCYTHACVVDVVGMLSDQHGSAVYVGMVVVRIP